MSNIYKFKEFLNLSEAIKYLTFSTKKEISFTAFEELTFAPHLLPYKWGMFKIVPISLDDSGDIIDIHNDSPDFLSCCFIPLSSRGLHLTECLCYELNGLPITYHILDDKNNNFTVLYYDFDVKNYFPLMPNGALYQENIFFKSNDIFEISKLLKEPSKYILPKSIVNFVAYKDLDDQSNRHSVLTMKTYVEDYQLQTDDISEVTIKDTRKIPANKLGSRERNNLYRVIASLLIDCKMHELGQYQVAEALIHIAALNSIEGYPSDDTVANIIKASKNFITDSNPN